MQWGSRAAVVLAVIGVLAATMARSQIAGRDGSAAPGPVTNHVYSDPELHLTYAYPAELTEHDDAFAGAAGRRMIYGEEAESDAAKASACVKVLLSVGAGREGSPGKWVRLGLVEVSGQCFPAKVMQNRKAMQILLRNFVRQGTTAMGMMPLDQPARYEIQGHAANFCAAQGTPMTGSDLQTAEPQLIGTAAVAVEGRVVAWVIETNDAGRFNQLLGSSVDFGTGKTERLFPGRVN